MDFIWPAPGTTVITSGVGPRWGTNHNGLDISSGDAFGNPIVAAAAGRVIVAVHSGWGGGYGIHCYIDHGGGYITRYGHMSRLLVNMNQTVKQGDKIGEIGSTGDSTGPHLHFEIRLNGAVMDPENYVNPNKSAALNAGAAGASAGSSVTNRVKAMFTAYYPADNAMEGGFLDALENRLDPSKKTMAAPSCVAFHEKVTIEGTGTERDGTTYEVLDRGGAITVDNGVYHFDILMRTEADCNAWGVKYGYAVIGGSGSSGGTSSTESESESKEITTVVTKSISGTASSIKSKLTDVPAYLKNGVEILLQVDKIYQPVIEGDVTLERYRKGSPSKLTFNVVKDSVIKYPEGSPVSMRFNGKKVFHGFVFTKSRSDLTTIKTTAYDQMRYLKNQDTLSYTNKTYSELLKMIAKDYGLKTGTVEDTKYKIPHRIEECTLMDMLQNASDETVLNTGKLFVLYDDFGKLCLKNIENMKLDLVVDEETAQGYDYTSTIDENVYNKIKIAVDNDETGEREVYVTNDTASQSKWGQLQYYEKLDGVANAAAIKEKAKVLLDYYNRKNRTLKVKGVMGDIRVRGGSSVVVMLNLGNIKLQNYMCVDYVKHTFSPGIHTMDLTLVGVRGEFTA